MEMPIPDDWDGTSYCRFAVCWPNSPLRLAVLRGQVTEPARGWFWDAKSGNLLQTLSDFRTTLDQNISLQEVIVACNDDNLRLIALAINNLAKAQCCDGIPQGGGIQGQVPDGEGGFVPIYGSSPGIELPPGEAPPDYDGTYEQFLTDKCNGAHFIVDGAIFTLNQWATWNFTTQIGLTAFLIAALAGIIIINPYLIPVLIGALILSTGINAGLVSLADGIEDNRTPLVCAMYEANTAGEIIAIITPLIGSVIAAIPATGTLAYALRVVAALIFNTDTLDQLFKATIPGVPGRDCSECDACDTENDVIFEFSADIVPFELDADFVTSEPAYNGQVGDWQLLWGDVSEALVMSVAGGTANTHALAIAPIEHTIGLGDSFYVQHTVNSGTISYACVLMEADGTIIAGFSQGTTSGDTFATSLDEHVGRDVAYIGVYAARAGSTSFVSFTNYIRILCE